MSNIVSLCEYRKKRKPQNIIGCIIDVDYSHGIIYAEIDTGDVIEAYWSGFSDLNQFDMCNFIVEYDDLSEEYSYKLDQKLIG